MNTDTKNQHDPAGFCPPVSRIFEVAEYVGKGFAVPEGLIEFYEHACRCAFCGDIIEGAKWAVRREICEPDDSVSPLSPLGAVEGTIIMSLPPQRAKGASPYNVAPSLFRISIGNSESPLVRSESEIFAGFENLLDSSNEQNCNRFLRRDGDTLVYIVRHEQEAATNVDFVISSGAAFDRRQKRIPPGRKDRFYKMSFDRVFAVPAAWTEAGSENEDTVIEIRIPSISAENGNAERNAITRVIRFSAQVWKQTGVRNVTISRQ